MNETVKKDIISVLNQTIDVINEKEFSILKQISNKVIHNASTYQDADSINTAVLIYTLYKIAPNLSENELKKLIESLENAQKSLSEGNFVGYNNSYKNIYHILEINKEIKKSVVEVLNQARIKKGTNLIYHGISLSQAANLFGISQWDLMNYLGKSKIYDTFESEIDIEERLDTLRKIL